MKALLLAIAIAMSSAFSQGHCAANIAQIPVGLRQSYGDGTTTELALDNAAMKDLIAKKL